MRNATQAGFASFNEGVARMATQGRTFGETMQATWNSMAASFITATLRMAERWAVAQLAKVGIAQATNAAAAASAKETSFITQIHAAKAAAAKTMEVVPFPLNIPAAGAVFAIALAFEKGGLVPGSAGMPVPIVAHAGEMVLPANLSSFIQSSAGRSEGRGMAPPGSTSRPIVFQYHAHAHSVNADGVEDMLSAHGDRIFNFMRGKLRKMGYNTP